MTQLPLEIAPPEKESRKYYDLDCQGHMIIEGKKYLVKFRDYNRFRSIKVRKDGIDGIRLIHTEDKLLRDTKKLNEFMRGEITII